MEHQTELHTGEATEVTPIQHSGLLVDLRKLLEGMEKKRLDIENALAYTGGTHTIDDLVGMVLQQRLTFWELENSFFISEILEYPREKHLHIFLAGGRFSEIIAMQGRMVQLAKNLGCAKLTISGRPGWLKRLPTFGWKHHHSTMALDLGDPSWQAAAAKAALKQPK